MSLSSSANPSASHFLPFFATAPLFALDFFECDSSPEEACAEVAFAALRALLEPLPPGPPFPISKWPAGVVGRELSAESGGLSSFVCESPETALGFSV